MDDGWPWPPPPPPFGDVDWDPRPEPLDRLGPDNPVWPLPPDDWNAEPDWGAEPDWDPEPDWGTDFGTWDGWRYIRRLHPQVRRPGARDSNFKYYLMTVFPDCDRELIKMAETHCEQLVLCQNFHERKLLEFTANVAEGYPHPLHQQDCWTARSHYDRMRMSAMLVWVNMEAHMTPHMMFEAHMNGWSTWSSPEQLPSWVVRKFEKEAWCYDKGHKRVLAARRRLTRVILGCLLRRAVARCAIALYWQEQTQRALCAPGGPGRAADAAAFASEF